MIIDGDGNLKLKTHDGIYLIGLDDIFYFKAEGAYSQLIQTDEHSILICKQLCVIQRVLKKHDFVRIHKSFLINISRVTYFESKNRSIYIQNNMLPISRRKASSIYQKLLEYGIKDGRN